VKTGFTGGAEMTAIHFAGGLCHGHAAVVRLFDVAQGWPVACAAE
jgi:hypothetical protein